MVVAVGIGSVIHLRNGMPGRIDLFYPEMTSVIDRAKNDPKWKLHGKWEERTKKIGEGIIPPIVGKNGIIPTFALAGDSHARAMIPAIEQEAIRTGKAGYIITASSTPLLEGVSIISSNSSNDNGFNEPPYNKSVLAFIKNTKSIQTVILVARWGAYIQGHWTAKTEDPLTLTLIDEMGGDSKGRSNATILSIGLARTVNTLRKMKLNVVLVSDVPEIGYDVPRIYMMQSRFSFLMKGTEYRPSIAEYQERQKEANAILEELAQLSNVTLIRPEKLMFDETGQGRIMANGELLYRDDDHLSTAGALYIAPVFDEVFKDMVDHPLENKKLAKNSPDAVNSDPSRSKALQKADTQNRR
jgi:hypothetical protein